MSGVLVAAVPAFLLLLLGLYVGWAAAVLALVVLPAHTCCARVVHLGRDVSR